MCSVLLGRAWTGQLLPYLVARGTALGEAGTELNVGLANYWAELWVARVD